MLELNATKPANLCPVPSSVVNRIAVLPDLLCTTQIRDASFFYPCLAADAEGPESRPGGSHRREAHQVRSSRTKRRISPTVLLWTSDWLRKLERASAISKHQTP